MKRFLEVIPGVFVSTRRIETIEVHEYGDTNWQILIFTDIRDNKGEPITYVYNHQIFTDKKAAMVKLAEIVGKCGGADA